MSNPLPARGSGLWSANPARGANVRVAFPGSEGILPSMEIRQALALSFQMSFQMEQKQLALDAEIRGLLEVRGQDALAPDIG